MGLLDPLQSRTQQPPAYGLPSGLGPHPVEHREHFIRQQFGYTHTSLFFRVHHRQCSVKTATCLRKENFSHTFGGILGVKGDQDNHNTPKLASQPTLFKIPRTCHSSILPKRGQPSLSSPFSNTHVPPTHKPPSRKAGTGFDPWT